MTLHRPERLGGIFTKWIKGGFDGGATGGNGAPMPPLQRVMFVNLGLIHGRVCFSEQFPGSFSIFRVEGQSHGHANGQWFVGFRQHERRFYGAVQSFQAVFEFIGDIVSDQRIEYDNEFIPFQSG